MSDSSNNSLNENEVSVKTSKKKKPVKKVKTSKVSSNVNESSFNFEYLKKYGILVGCLIFIFLIACGVTFASRKSWNNGLSVQVAKILEASGEYKVCENVLINSGFSVSGGIYRVEKEGSANEYYAMILRVQTVYGPVPAVFLYEYGKDYSTFVGLPTIRGALQTQIIEVSRNSQIAYWENYIPNIILSSVVKEGE